MPNSAPNDCGIESAIQAGKFLGDAKKNPHPHGRAYTFDDNGALVYLECPASPPRRTGTVKLSDVASFLTYWGDQALAPSRVFGSIKPAQFVAVFNEHEKTLPDWRDHRALLTLAYSKEWSEWTGRNGQPFDGNEAFAVWLEDNLPDIVNPDPAKFMDIALNFRVKQIASFSNAVRLADGNIDLTFSNQVEAGGNSAAGGKLKIPETFTISIPVFDGLDSPKYKVEARFRYRLVSGVLKLRFELVRPHKVVETAFKDLLGQIEKATKTKVLFGTPE